MGVRLFALVGATAVVVVALGPAPSGGAAPATGSVHVVQAVPGESVDVRIDEQQTRRGVGVGAVLGPFQLTAGRHVVQFVAGGAEPVSTAVQVKAGASTDVVLHLPAAVSGTPVVNTYATPLKAIGPGKARVLLAHTATVAPADVQLDGKIVFTNIANGEFAEADVPAGAHRVALLPTGGGKPILGPIDVDLSPRTVTMVYAVGRPSNGSMKVIAHADQLAPDGTVVPDKIMTGSAGLAALLPVAPFASSGPPPVG